MRSESALNYNKYFSKKKLKKLPARIRYKGWFLLKILEQRKIRKIYGNISLTRLKFIYKNILKSKGDIFLNFLKILEYRLDVIVFKLNLFTTIKFCQNIIRLKRVSVNNIYKNFNYIVKVDDLIKIVPLKQKSTNYVLNFIYKDKYYNILKQVYGIYLYRFLLNLNIFKNLKQIYFYIKKGLILVNNVVIKFARYKLAFNKTSITIKSLGIKKKIRFNIKNFLIYNVNNKKNLKLFFDKSYFNFIKFYIYYSFNYYNYIINLSKTNINNLIFNFLKSKYIFNYKSKNYFLKINKNIKYTNISKNFLIVNYKQPLIIKYKWIKNINLKKKLIKNNKKYLYLYNFKRKNLFIFKIKKNIYIHNNNNFYINKYFKRLKFKKRNYKFFVLENKKLLTTNTFLKKYSLHKVQHLEMNYKINTAILLKYFNIKSISSKDLVYLGIVSYYFFQYT